MTDIVDRLRTFAPSYEYDGERKRNSAIIDDAIAEIKSLRDKLDENRKQVSENYAEIVRLRTRIQDEVERNEARENAARALLNVSNGNDFERLTVKASTHQAVARELSHILTQG